MKGHKRRNAFRLVSLLFLAGCAALVAGLVLFLQDSPRDRIKQYLPLIEQNAVKFKVEASLISAVILAESGARGDAVSPKGARGLMQLMPATARDMAKKLGRNPVTPDELLDPAKNIELGVCYLAQVLSDFSGDATLAVAAYNAGPARVKEWVKKGGGKDSGEIIRRHAFKETRSYVKKVLDLQVNLCE